MSLGRAARHVNCENVECHARNVPGLSTIEMSLGCGFTLPKKKLASSCPEIFFAARSLAELGFGEGAGEGAAHLSSLLAVEARLRETAGSARDS